MIISMLDFLTSESTLKENFEIGEKPLNSIEKLCKKTQKILLDF